MMKRSAEVAKAVCTLKALQESDEEAGKEVAEGR